MDRERLMGDTEKPEYKASGCHVCSLGLHVLGRRHLELSAEDAVPKATSDAEAIVEICEMMLKVVLLERLVIGREAFIGHQRLADIKRSARGPGLLTCGGGGSSGSCHNRHSRKHLHRRLSQRHTSCRRTPCALVYRMGWPRR